ncbi:metallopeptidase family protein [Bifidobacterium callimiconis]|uniref:Zn-dependent protease n=1 Tax=Bifidobacterium callimiconis TaxID=2306973 RepID=A0A430FHM3_9BIFI|nr:metallopeptidase family protein [Bifidobacterium callimiconis]MBT1177913.1 metallopeptidase family protein [Bifidobacterium callimiconis]RSX52349.1 Zn-dependent protease [Bifidobacterium callimiconis]
MRISDEEFEKAIEEALQLIPARFHRALDNIGIAMDDEPNERELATMESAYDELLGLYEGIPLPQRTNGYGGVMPDIITIFKGPHERICTTHEELVTQIRKTVMHEIGHYFGFDDDYLHAHGY